MKTQFDSKVRVVSLANLEAMCEHISGTCHRFWIESASRSRVTVGYSNPDEYASDRPIFAVFPCYPSTFDGKENPAVVLDYLRILEGNDPTLDGEGWQCFEALRDCPVLWRKPQDGTWEAEGQTKVS